MAGLGIGGLALALAAQKTVENLFGAFSIGVDQPFSVGDFITVDGITGEVEAIGLRSTRIRTAGAHHGHHPQRQAGRHEGRDLRGARPHPLGRWCWAWSTTTAAPSCAPCWQSWSGRCGRTRRRSRTTWWSRFRAFGAEALEIEVSVYFLTTDYAEFGASARRCC